MAFWYLCADHSRDQTHFPCAFAIRTAVGGPPTRPSRSLHHGFRNISTNKKCVCPRDSADVAFSLKIAFTRTEVPAPTPRTGVAVSRGVESKSRRRRPRNSRVCACASSDDFFLIYQGNPQRITLLLLFAKRFCKTSSAALFTRINWWFKGRLHLRHSLSPYSRAGYFLSPAAASRYSLQPP